MVSLNCKVSSIVLYVWKFSTKVKNVKTTRVGMLSDMIEIHAHMYEILWEFLIKKYTLVCYLWLMFEMPHPHSQGCLILFWTPFLCLTPCFSLLQNVLKKIFTFCRINSLVLKFFSAWQPWIMSWPELVPKIVGQFQGLEGDSGKLYLLYLYPQMLTFRHYWAGYWV